MRLSREGCGCVCYTVVGIIVFLFLMIFVNSEDLRGWTEKRQGMAGWFQFGGSIIAIFGSAWVSTRIFNKEIMHREAALRREVSIETISLISGLISVQEGFRDFWKLYPKLDGIKEEQVVTHLDNLLKKANIPTSDFAKRIANVNTDCAKAIAITNEARRQLEPHLLRCRNSKYLFISGKPHPIAELALLISENLTIARTALEDFLRVEGMYVYTGNK